MLDLSMDSNLEKGKKIFKYVVEWQEDKRYNGTMGYGWSECVASGGMDGMLRRLGN